MFVVGVKFLRIELEILEVNRVCFDFILKSSLLNFFMKHIIEEKQIFSQVLEWKVPHWFYFAGTFLWGVFTSIEELDRLIQLSGLKYFQMDLLMRNKLNSKNHLYTVIIWSFALKLVHEYAYFVWLFFLLQVQLIVQIDIKFAILYFSLDYRRIKFSEIDDEWCGCKHADLDLL